MKAPLNNKNANSHKRESILMSPFYSLIESSFYKGLQTNDGTYELDKEKEKIIKEKLNRLINWFTAH